MRPTEGGVQWLERSFPTGECFPLHLGVSPLCYASLIFGGTVAVQLLFSTMCRVVCGAGRPPAQYAQ
jgi:hypothetical protein